MVIREMSHCESPNPQIAMSGRIDAMEFARHCVYSLARHVEKNYGGKSMGIPFSYPLEMDPEKNGSIADISLRHAAVAAGLGAFGRHNLVIHPSLGSRVLFCGILTDIEFESDPPCEKNPCINCNICVKECPAGALDEEGRTDAFKCLKVSQPYGLGKSVAFWNDFIKKTPWEQTKMFFTKDYWQMYQAQFIGFQYFCFNCYVVCPVGKINKQSS